MSEAIAKTQKQLLAKMTPDTQKIATRFSEKFNKTTLAIVLTQYDLGEAVAEMEGDEEKYGVGSIQLLATYLDVPGGANSLYAARMFAQTFERDFVRATTERPMANGQNLNFGHWLQLMRLEQPEKRLKMINKAITNSWSVNDLELEIRAGSGGATKNARGGGRKPSIPSSPVAICQKTIQISNMLTNWQLATAKSFAKLEELAPDAVTDALVLKADETITALDAVIEKATTMKEAIEASSDHLKGVLEARATAEYEEPAAKPKSAPTGKPKPAAGKPVAAKPSANGTAPVAKKKILVKKKTVAA